MPPFRKPSLVTLRRQDTSQPWGFRLTGGSNQGQPFLVQKVIPESIAHKYGLQEGNELVRIGNITLKGLTHEEVQEIILRCVSTIDLFIIRKEDENSENQTKDQQNIGSNRSISPYPSGNVAKSLTEEVQVVTEQSYYSNDVDYNNPKSNPLNQYYVKESETVYSYSDYHSPPLTKRPQSPLQKPPISGRPFSPTNRPFSPTSQIIYHQPEEQLWMSTSSPNQQRDPRVFAASPRRSSSPSPLPDQSKGRQRWSSSEDESQRDNRIFGAKPNTSSPSNSPVQGSREQPIDNRVFGAKPRVASFQTPYSQNQTNRSDNRPVSQSSATQLNGQRSNYPDSGPKTSTPTDQSRGRDDRVFAENKRQEVYSNQNFERPQVGRIIKDLRGYGKARPGLQKFGGSLEETPHWKEPLPQMQNVRTDQLLPSQTRQQQTYIVQTPPTEKLGRPPLLSSQRRRIRPVWPPPDAHGRFVQRVGFSPEGRESPSRKCNWPPNSDSYDDEYYYEDGMMSPGSPQLKYVNPSPGAMQQSWNPRSGSVTPPGVRSYRPSRRVRHTAWPPASNATPAGRSGYRPEAGNYSLPGSRRSSQTDDYVTYGSNARIPQTYRPPPGTQYFQQSYHYDTD